jgi:hypothetical protein
MGTDSISASLNLLKTMEAPLRKWVSVLSVPIFQ